MTCSSNRFRITNVNLPLTAAAMLTALCLTVLVAGFTNVSAQTSDLPAGQYYTLCR